MAYAVKEITQTTKVLLLGLTCFMPVAVIGSSSQAIVLPKLWLVLELRNLCCLMLPHAAENTTHLRPSPII